MDGSRFDTLTRSLTRLGSRRAVVRTLVAGSFGLLGLTGTAKAAKQCRPEGHPCEGNQRDSCCSGLVCMASGPGNAERCTSCPPGSVIFEGACCTPTTCPSGVCGSGISNECGGTIPCSCPIGRSARSARNAKELSAARAMVGARVTAR